MLLHVRLLKNAKEKPLCFCAPTNSIAGHLSSPLLPRGARFPTMLPPVGGFHGQIGGFSRVLSRVRVS